MLMGKIGGKGKVNTPAFTDNTKGEGKGKPSKRLPVPSKRIRRTSETWEKGHESVEAECVL